MTSPLTLTIEARSVYGNTLYYPVNEAARLLARIAGAKTLTLENIRLAVAMGCEIEAVGWSLSTIQPLAQTMQSPAERRAALFAAIR